MRSAYRSEVAAFTLIFPDYFDRDAPLIEAKGYFDDATIETGTARFRPVLYDQERFAQEVADEIASAGVYSERDVVIVARVTRPAIEAAVSELNARGFRGLTPRPLG